MTQRTLSDDFFLEPALVEKEAVISECGQYRYSLTRRWPTYADGGTLVFGMLNPSKADATINDNTITLCMNRARRLGYSELIVVNAFAYRATDPDDMKAVDDPIGPENDHYISKVFREHPEHIILACGAHVTHRNRYRQLGSIIENLGIKAYCLGLTKNGFPVHPRGIPNNRPLIPFPGFPK